VKDAPQAKGARPGGWVAAWLGSCHSPCRCLHAVREQALRGSESNGLADHRPLRQPQPQPRPALAPSPARITLSHAAGHCQLSSWGRCCQLSWGSVLLTVVLAEPVHGPIATTTDRWAGAPVSWSYGCHRRRRQVRYRSSVRSHQASDSQSRVVVGQQSKLQRPAPHS
jgi:hypothetical protein